MCLSIKPDQAEVLQATKLQVIERCDDKVLLHEGEDY